MRFVDQVRIHLKAGDGGKGCIAFRREKFIERGGPSGGDGGRGGDVVLIVDPQLTTLLDFSYQPRHFAKDGSPGEGSDCNGPNAADVVLRVPVGTVVKDPASGEILFDLDVPGQRLVICKGGRGGLGNMNFANAVRQAPRFAEPGRPGEEKLLVLELKLLADVGVVGFPNAGKSTLVSRLSKARPKIADYPFTTLTPQLGVAAWRDGHSFVIADIPGLIEGASAGLGLGHQFLRHVERCRVLIHLVDCGGFDAQRDPLADFDTINRELALHSPLLADKPQVVVGNKLDLTDGAAVFAKFQRALASRGIPALAISAASGRGLGPLLDRVGSMLFGTGAQRAASEAPRANGRPTPAKGSAKRPIKAKAPRPSAAAPAEARTSTLPRPTPATPSGPSKTARPTPQPPTQGSRATAKPTSAKPAAPRKAPTPRRRRKASQPQPVKRKAAGRAAGAKAREGRRQKRA